MKSFFKEVLKRLAVTLVTSVLFAILSIFILGALITSLLEESEVVHESNSVLTLNLSMNLTDRPGGFQLQDLTRQALADKVDPPQLHLWEVLQALQKAKDDKRVKALYIRGGFMPSGYGCGYASIQELLLGIKDFKKSKKPVIGFVHSPSQLDYLVFSVCDQLVMDPSGTLLLNGLSSQSIFLGEAFEKYGVGLQVVRTGDFKGAVEPFTSTEFSEENRAQIDRLINLRWQDFLTSVSQNRGVNFHKLSKKLSSKYLFEAEEAIEFGFVDSVLPYDQMVDLLSEVGSPAEERGFREIEFIDYLDRPESSQALNEDLEEDVGKVAVIYVEGTIIDGWGDDGEVVGGSEIVDRIQEVRADKDYKAVVLRINSPGGSVSGSDAILQELRRLRSEQIPVVVSMGSVAASGGYWISTECDHLFASEQTITGSIGVFGLLPNLKEVAGKFGVYWDSVKTHQHSDIMTLARPKTEGEIEVIQKYVDSIYAKFISLVAKARNMPEDEVLEISEGRVWTGVDAKMLGLVDAFGGLGAAMDKAVHLAKLGDDYKIIEFPGVQTPIQAFEEIFGAATDVRKQNSASQFSSLSRLNEELKLALSTFRGLNDPRQAYGLLPWYRRGFGFVD